MEKYNASNEVALMEKEVSSPLMRTIYSNLCRTMERLDLGVIDTKKANVQISGEKHKLQAVAMSWLREDREDKFKQLTKK